MISVYSEGKRVLAGFHAPLSRRRLSSNLCLGVAFGGRTTGFLARLCLKMAALLGRKIFLVAKER